MVMQGDQLPASVLSFCSGFIIEFQLKLFSLTLQQELSTNSIKLSPKSLYGCLRSKPLHPEEEANLQDWE